MKPFRAGILMPLTAMVLVGGWMRYRVPDVVWIGVGAPLTGSLAHHGQDLLDGVQLAVEEINAKGGVMIGGKPVRLGVVSADDKADVKVGLSAAQYLVNRDVLVAVAHLNSGVSIATADVYAKAGVPQLAISTKAEYTRLGLPTTLRLVANDDLQSRAIGNYALQMAGVSRIAVVDDASPYGKGLADQATQVLTNAGRSIAFRRSFDNKSTEFGDLVAMLEQQKIDLLISTLSDFQVAQLIGQLAKANLQRIRILGGDTLKTTQLTPMADEVAGVYATSPILEAREFMLGNRFLDRFNRRFHHDPVYAAHYTYDAVFLVADALSRNGSVDREALLERLKQFDGIAPVTGTMRFDTSGEQRHGSIGVYKLTASGWQMESNSDRW